MNTQELYETIEAYLNGEMTDEEKTAFEAQLNQDESLAQEVQLHADIVLTLQSQQKLKHKQHWQQLLADEAKNKQAESKETIVFNPANSRNIFGNFLFRIAAILLLAVGTYFVWQQFTVSDNPGQLAWQQWTETETTNQWSGIRGTGGNTADAEKEVFTKAVELYKNQEYNTAIENLNAIPLQSTIYPDAQLLQSMSYLQLKQPGEAISRLTVLVQPENDHLLKDQASWYLALAYLQNNQTSFAKELLEKIVSDKSMHWDRAGELLKKID